MVEITVLPLDLERELTSNIRTNEKHDAIVARGKVNRVIVPDFGAFFTEGFELRDVNGVALERHKGFELTYHYEMFSELTGQGVSALVVITDKDAVGPFSITYHAVGGNFSLSVKELGDVIAYICSAEYNTIKWDDIIDKPTAYVPEVHFNKFWQLIGLDTTVVELERLAHAITVGRKGIVDSNTDYWYSYATDAQLALDNYKAAVQAHVTDRNNPHATDKYKINLGNVFNWPMATAVTAVDITNNASYMPIGGIYRQLALTAIPSLDQHIQDVAAVGHPDPHNVTLAQINAYSKEQVNQMFALRLNRNQAAYDTTLFSGITYDQFKLNIRSNLNTSNVLQGYFTPYDPSKVFQMNQMAPVPAVPDSDLVWYILCGDQQYRHVRDMIANWNSTRSSVVFVGNRGNRNDISGAIAAITAYNPPGGVPINTQAIASYERAHYSRARSQQLIVYIMTAGGWVRQI